MKWTHCALETRKFEQTLQFYVDFCHMNVATNRIDDGRKVVHLIPAVGSGPILVLIESKQLDYTTEVNESMLRHFGFELSSRQEVDLVYKKLIEADLPATQPVYVDENTGYVCMSQDPDKRWVEFSYGQSISSRK